jgi:hypothetical protein
MAKKLTGIQWDLICYSEQYWRENGFFPSAGELSLELRITPKQVEEILFDELTKKHLKVRGIDWNIDRPNSDSKASDRRSGRAKRLSDIQIATVSTILNPADKRSVTAKLEALGVSPGTYANWKKSKVFMDYMNSQGESLFGEFMPDMHNSLIGQATKGNVQAIKFAYEVSGRYRPKQGEETANVRMIIIKLIEIIQRHVNDPMVLQAIANDVQAIQKGLEPNGQHNEIRSLPTSGI